MSHRIRTFPLLFLLGAIPNATADNIDYLRDIKPVLKAKCYSCHGALKQEANLRLDTVQQMRVGGDSGPAVKEGDERNSLLIQRITAENEDERMPPEGEPLSPEQISRLTAWLWNGANGPAGEKPQTNPANHWAFQPLKTVVPPQTGHPIDAFVDRRLRSAELQRSPQAAPVALVRRMFLDLHGLPPTAEQLDEWTKKLQDDAAVRSLVDALLASPRYGERWAQHWLDIVRYADTHGYEVNTPRPNAWPYRDYVISAFNDDKPYDRFVFEQLAGDTVEADAATGFMVAAAALLPGQIGKDEESKRLARQDELDEIIIGTSATFLGLTVGCARCHDHKFDPIPQTDYYAFQAFFAGVDYGDREIRDETFHQNIAKADLLQPKITMLRQQLSEAQPKAFTGRTLIIDDEDLEHVTLLTPKNGHGSNPPGEKRGYQNDSGTASRSGNISGGRYTWFTNTPGQDVFTWNPNAAGRFRVWISWGSHGSGVHTHDARYVLDEDGDLSTSTDQTEIAQADQYYFAGVTKGDSEKKPLWSGLQHVGVHRITEASRVVLRSGDTETGITADVIVLQEVLGDDQSVAKLPRLRAPVNALKNVERFAPVDAKFVRFTSLQTIDGNKHQPCIDELQVFTVGTKTHNVALAELGTVATSSGNYSETGKHQLKHINDGKFGNSFSWISNEHGKGWVQLEFSKPQSIDRIEWGRDREGKFKDRLPVQYRIETSNDGISWSLISSSDDRVPPGTPHDDRKAMLRNGDTSEDSVDGMAIAKQLQQLEQQDKDLRKTQLVFAGKFRTPSETYLLNRGDPEQPTVKLAPHVLTSLSAVALPMDAADKDRRTTLANWITSPDNPLTARVIVNRIWQYHFGVGLVETSSDFGLNGSEPTHPELLDWLAADFMANGWSVKHLHRRILSSQTYQQASSRPDGSHRTAVRIDADNQLLWRFPARRLEAEAIRDCILHVSGKLNDKMGGPGFNFFKTRGGLSGFPPVEEFTSEELRRMVYAHKIRMERVPIFGAFDCPDAGLPTPRRSQSTTAIQALNLLNSSFVIEQAEEFAKRVESEGKSQDDQIDLAFRLALGRLPTVVEKPVIADVVQGHGLSTLCRALFNSSEFLFIP